ncbi:MAG: TolC family protein [Candidatus Acidiferrales bacterium]
MFRNRRTRHLIFFLAVLLTLLASAPGLSRAQTQSHFTGSVPTGQATGTVLRLSLHDAFDRALKYNLGAIESDQDTRAAHAVRLRSLNALLPNLSARVSASLEQINFKAQGLNISIPGVAIPIVVGPFGVTDARAYLSQEIFNWSDIQGWKSAAESETASRYTYQSDRDLVVFTAGDAYLLVLSDLATVDSTRAQVTTAQTLYQQDADRNKHGLVASIDVLRAQVELQTEQQRLIAAENQLAIDKLSLARVIGLPNGQEFELTDSVPYAPLDGITLDQALRRAYSMRSDYLSDKAQVQAAELALRASAAENYPNISTATDYGDIGSPNFTSSHGTLDFAAALNIPIFQGSRVRADKLQADSALQQRKAELADLGGKIDDDVRTAFYNLKSSSDLVAVARSNIDLANQTLAQSRDRFAAGVADNLEVVQAQESVAVANQSYIASLYSFNLAKISLAQALGVAQQSALRYLLGGN